MTDVRAATEDLLEDRPDLDDPLQELLEIDESGSWEFDDIPLDSGTFGEIVSRDIVEKVDGGAYRVADRNAVKAALTDEDDTKSSKPSTSVFQGIQVPHLPRRVALAIATSLLLVVAIRIAFVFQGVFRGEDIVLLSNDPYAYRYYVETALQSGLNPLSPSDIIQAPFAANLQNEVFLLLTLWWISSIVGGTSQAAGMVLAWYPVIAGLITAGFVYLIAVRVSKDRRIGIASLVVMAVIGINAQRTALGFSDHHAFDAIWLGLTILGVTVLADHLPSYSSLSDLRTAPISQWFAAIAIGIGVFAQTISWRGAPLLMLPIGVYTFLRVQNDLQRSSSPLLSNAPLVVGVGLGTLLVLITQLISDWLITARVLFPILLVGGIVFLVVTGEAAYRSQISPKLAIVGQIGIASIGVGLAVFTIPQVSAGLDTLTGFFQSLSGSTIAETIPFFGGAAGYLLGPLFHFGLIAYLILPYVGWGIWTAYRDDQPLVPMPLAVYTLAFFLLAMLQYRFAFHLSLGASIFGGMGLVHIGSEINLCSPPNIFRISTVRNWEQTGGWNLQETFSAPTIGNTIKFALLFVFVFNLALFTAVFGFSDMTYTDSQYSTAKWIDSHAAQEQIEYPENYVLTRWAENRFYNYFVNGQSRSYGYAYRFYEDFIADVSSDGWYRRFARKPVGYILTYDVGSDKQQNQHLLHVRHGGGTANLEGSGHFQTVYVDSESGLQIHEPVPGAYIAGTGDDGEKIAIGTNVSIEGDSFRYTRYPTITDSGWYGATLAYPGTYSIAGSTLELSEDDIQSGEFISEESPYAHWSFESGEGEFAYDPDGLNHMQLRGGSWNSDGTMQFTGGQFAHTLNDTSLSASDTLAVTVKFKLNKTSNASKRHYIQTLVSKGSLNRVSPDNTEEIPHPRNLTPDEELRYLNASGYHLQITGDNIRGVVGSESATTGVTSTTSINDSRWHTATLVVKEDQISLFVDGDQEDSSTISTPLDSTGEFRLGRQSDGPNPFYGEIDEVAISLNDSATHSYPMDFGS